MWKRNSRRKFWKKNKIGERNNKKMWEENFERDSARKKTDVGENLGK